MGKRNVDGICNVVMTCNGSDCKRRGSKDLERCARRVARDLGSKKTTMFVRTKCTGLCKQAPVIMIQPANEFVLEADEKSVEKALRRHLAIK